MGDNFSEKEQHEQFLPLQGYSTSEEIAPCQ
jgi:hypothetical protein